MFSFFRRCAGKYLKYLPINIYLFERKNKDITGQKTKGVHKVVLPRIFTRCHPRPEQGVVMRGAPLREPVSCHILGEPLASCSRLRSANLIE